MIKINVCIGSACHVKGSYNVINSFQQLIEEYKLTDKAEVNAVFCLGQCTHAVSVRIGDGEVHSVSGASARDFFVQKIVPATGK
ncbi:MAG TPA: (2Fe-2S) ferredoxin domain-containing protein [Selenomonadales bacterium]|nr:(2Fe-2S) ferredoxin domain-containing protein [Selenomonadales bacterium]